MQATALTRSNGNLTRKEEKNKRLFSMEAHVCGWQHSSGARRFCSNEHHTSNSNTLLLPH